MRREKILHFLAIPFTFFFILSLASVPVSAATLPSCSKIYSGIYKPIEKEVRAAVVKFYTAKKLAPVTIYKNREQIITVKLWTVGVHYCLNPGGGKGGYVGALPKTATSAVQVYAKHKPYPGTAAPSHFLMLAKTKTKGWTVYSEGTGP